MSEIQYTARHILQKLETVRGSEEKMSKEKRQQKTEKSIKNSISVHLMALHCATGKSTFLPSKRKYVYSFIHFYEWNLFSLLYLIHSRVVDFDYIQIYLSSPFAVVNV